jgi:hypothetical protein
MEKKIDRQTGNIINVGTAVNPTISAGIVNVTIQQQTGSSLSLQAKPRSQSVGRYITDSGADRYILDDYDDEDEFEFYPDPLYVLSLYFITLVVPHEKREDEYYAVVDFVNYCPTVKNGRFNDEIWSVPYTIHPLDLKGVRVRSVREIRAVYESELKGLSSTLETLEKSLFYNLGIVYKELEKGREYIEYKRSATEPNKMRCNYVREFYVKAIDSNGLINLVDPENLHQHRYLPLPLNALQYNGLIHFLDKPLPMNVTDVLQSRFDRLKHQAITVSYSKMMYEQKGILFRITDVVSSSEPGGLRFFDPNLEDILDSCLMKHGIGWYLIQGNQVLGTLPQGMGDNERGRKPLIACQIIESLLEDIYHQLSLYMPWLKNKLCCSITYESFRYGKQYSLSSRYSAFEVNNNEQFEALHAGLIDLASRMSSIPECDQFGTVPGANENYFKHGILIGVDRETDSYLLPNLPASSSGDFEYSIRNERRTLKYICKNCIGDD